MGKQGVFIAERHFLPVWVYSLLRVYRAPTAHEAAQPAMRYMWPWGGGGIESGMVLQAQLCLSLSTLVNLLSTHWFEHQFQP